MSNLCEKYEFKILPRHYHNTQAFTEMPRHLRKSQNYDITANIYISQDAQYIFLYILKIQETDKTMLHYSMI
jgi:hypothetical protein